MKNEEEEEPDLIGLPAMTFTDQCIECKVSLNNIFFQGRFKPLMLERVRLAHNESIADYDKVVVCEKGSAIQFTITVKGHNGFGYSITPSSGINIVENLYGISNDLKESTATVLVQRYQKMAKKMIIDSTATQSIPWKKSIRYQRIAVTVWRLDSFEKNGQTVTVNHSSNRAKREIEQNTLHSIETTKNSETQDNSSNKTSGETKLVHGNSIAIGGTRPAAFSWQLFESLANIIEDRSDILGRIVMDFFVAETEEDAQAILEKSNSNLIFISPSSSQKQ